LDRRRFRPQANPIASINHPDYPPRTQTQAAASRTEEQMSAAVAQQVADAAESVNLEVKKAPKVRGRAAVYPHQACEGGGGIGVASIDRCCCQLALSLARWGIRMWG